MTNAVDEKLLQVVERYYKLGEEKKLIEKELDGLKEKLLQVFNALDTKELAVDKYIVKLSAYQRDNFQPAKFKEDHPDMYQEYTQKVDVKTIRINETKGRLEE